MPFFTITKEGQGIYKEKGSKFLGFAIGVKDEQNAKHIISQFKKKYHDARHVCYAYHFAFPSPLSNASDDKEPAHTAGKPILNQILVHHLTHSLVIVVRYFGGTLLGTAGLIKAYRSSAQAAIENATLSPYTHFLSYSCKIPIHLYPKFIKTFHEQKIFPQQEIFAEKFVKISFQIEEEKEKNLKGIFQHFPETHFTKQE